MNLAIAQRELRGGQLARLELASQLGAMVVTIGLAWLTRSVWSLAIGTLAGTALRTLLSHLYLDGPPVRPCWDKAHSVEILGFGKWIFVSSIIGFLAAHGEKILLAAYLPAAQFGVFSIASTFLVAITGLYSTINGHVVYASLSHATRSDNPQEARRMHARVQKIADVLLGVLAGGLFMSGSWIIHLLYDPRYSEAGWMLQWLSLGLLAMRYQVAEQLMFARGKPQWVSANNALRALLLAIGIPLGHHLGDVQGALIAVVLSQFGSWPLSIRFKAREGLLSWHSELIWLPAMALGAAAGWLLDQLLKTLLT